MKRETRNSRQVVDRFLAELGEPVSEEQSERASANVLNRLRSGDLRFPSAATAAPSARTAGARVRVAIAAAVAVMIAGAVLPLALRQPASGDAIARSVRGELYEPGGPRPLPLSTAIEAGKVVRAGGSGGSLALPDGSEIDMSPDAELSVVRAEDGLRVRLASGTVLVTAAKQRRGHLYVETKDCVVSVIGTVFAVSAEKSGSRVAVIEGEVQVRRGGVSETLLAGQQATTSPELMPLPADTGAGWVAPERLVLLQQAAPVAPAQAAAEESGVVVRGVVKQASGGAGIPDVTVTLYPASAGTRVRIGVAQNPANPDQPVPQGGPIVRNKSFYFAAWDRGIVAARAIGASTTSTTDSMGRFQFPNVSPGEYIVRAEREGYAGTSTLGSPAFGQARGVFRYWNGWSPGSQTAATANTLDGESQEVTVEAQKTPPELSLTMTRAGVIAGRVRDPDGRMLVNAPVRIVRLPDPGTPGDGPVLVTSITNDLGEYRAYWLLPGEYRVLAAGPAGSLFSETWFPRGATSAEAIAVTVREGEEVMGIDVTLLPLQLDAPLRTPVRNWIR